MRVLLEGIGGYLGVCLGDVWKVFKGLGRGLGSLLEVKRHVRNRQKANKLIGVFMYSLLSI